MEQITPVLLGAVLPPVIDFLTKTVTSSKVRFYISLAVCVLVGVLINFNNLAGSDILASVALVFSSAQVIYKTYWKESTLRADANKGQD